MVPSHIRAFMGRRLTFRLTTVSAIVMLLVMLTVVCVLVLRQNDILRDEASLYQALAAPVVGRDVPPISGLDWRGARRVVRYGEDKRPTLIYTFSKDCGPCASNWVAMRALQDMAPNRLRIVYVDLIDVLTDDYVREQRLVSDIVFSALDPDSARHYPARATPQTELVDRTGRVVWSKLGKFSQTDVATCLAIIEQHNRQ